MAPGSSPGVTAEIKRKAPPCGGAFLALACFRLELAISLRSGILVLTARVLLLLARLLAAALLLAGLLARVLILLARVLVGVAHSESPLLNATARQRANPALVSQELRFHRDHCVALVCPNCGAGTPERKLALYKPFKPHSALLPHPVPAVRKRHDASFRLPGPP